MRLKSMRCVWAGVALAALLPLSVGAAMLADGRITGKVLKQDGSVAEGVPVRVLEAPAGGPRRGDGQGNRSVQPGPGDRPGRPGGGPGAAPGGWARNIVAETTTGKDGTFSVSVGPGDYVVVAGRRGEGMARTRVTVEEGKTVNIDLKLEPAGPGRGDGSNRRPPSN